MVRVDVSEVIRKYRKQFVQLVFFNYGKIILGVVHHIIL